MKKLNRFDTWERNYKQALDDIEVYSTAPATAVLAQWMLSTEVLSRRFLPKGWTGALNGPGEFSGLLAVIHHALVDDGDIEFVSVNGMPRMVFCNRHEEAFREVALTPYEQLQARTKVQVLDCTADEFGTLVEAADTAELKRCFAIDAGREGVDFAVKHYSSAYCYDPSWIEELAPQIKKWKDFYNK